MGNILKKHLDQALQGEKVAQGLGFFLRDKNVNIYQSVEM